MCIPKTSDNQLRQAAREKPNYTYLKNNGWREIYEDTSLPFNTGDKFLVRRNFCECSTDDYYGCKKHRPCVESYSVLNDDYNITEYLFGGNKTITERRKSIVRRFSWFKIIELSHYKIAHPNHI